MKRSRTIAAFTLIELLVAMAIFALVLAAIYSTWTLILRSSKIGLAAAAQTQRERMAVRTMEDALICTRSFAADIQHYGFVAENGSDATLSFVARLPKSFPRSGKFGDFDVRRVTFSLENGSDSSRELVVRQNPILMDPDQDEENHPLVLAKGVEELRFEFWDTQANDWVDEWLQTNQIPKMVKLTLRFAPLNRQNSYSRPREEVTRIVAIPSIMVPAALQSPNLGRPGQPLVPGQPITPGQPGQPITPGQ